jgi:hypothetical protein
MSLLDMHSLSRMSFFERGKDKKISGLIYFYLLAFLRA